MISSRMTTDHRGSFWSEIKILAAYLRKFCEKVSRYFVISSIFVFVPYAGKAIESYKTAKKKKTQKLFAFHYFFV